MDAEPQELCTASAEEAPQLAALKKELAAELATKEPWGAFAELTGDIRLLRFVRGYEGDIPGAAAAYRKHLEWRADNGVDAIRQECVDKGLKLRWEDLPQGTQIQPHMPAILDAGRSRTGRHHVHIENPGLINPEKILGTGADCIGVETFTRNWIYMLEIRNKLQDDLSRASGHMIRTVQVRDMEQVGMQMLSRQNMGLVRMLLDLTQNNYPECMEKIVFINAGGVFSSAMGMLKPFLSKRTLQRFLVISDRSYYPELLPLLTIRPSLQSVCRLAHVARTQVAGGTTAEAEAADRAGSVTVPARDHADIHAVIFAGQTARWEWSVEAHDVGCTVRFLSDGGWSSQLMQVPPPTSTASLWAAAGSGAHAPISGEHEASEDGVLVLSWDNTHSLMRSKTVKYSVAVSGDAQTPPASAATDDDDDDDNDFEDAAEAQPEPDSEPDSAIMEAAASNDGVATADAAGAGGSSLGQPPVGKAPKPGDD